MPILCNLACRSWGVVLGLVLLQGTFEISAKPAKDVMVGLGVADCTTVGNALALHPLVDGSRGDFEAVTFEVRLQIFEAVEPLIFEVCEAHGPVRASNHSCPKCGI